jgi:1-deoxy-D-xylulose-5-phosphate reductoisomerase
MPDMRLPISYALCAPGRSPLPHGVIDWATLGTLTFEAPDRDAFPCLGLAYQAAKAGGGAPAVLNGANEVAVAAFLEGRLRWAAIAEVVDEVLGGYSPGNLSSFEDVLEADSWARHRAGTAVDRRSVA